MEEQALKSLADHYLATHGIILSDDQAKLVLQIKNVLLFNSTEFHFTIWEESDFNLTSFKTILTPEQYEVFKGIELKNLHSQEQGLMNQDLTYEQQIKPAVELINHYEQVFLPSIRNNLLVPVFFNRHIEEVQYLRAAFRKYLASAEKALLVMHYRYNRRYMPKLLELSLLLHQQSVIFPDYPAFRRSMQAPTIAVADYLEEILRRGSKSFTGDSFFSFEVLMKSLK